MTGIVEQATKVLSSEPPRIKPESYVLPTAGSGNSSPGISAGQLQEQVKVLIDQFVALASPRTALDGAMPRGAPSFGRDWYTAEAQTSLEPAPVLSPAGSVMPGTTAQISITLVNDDDHPAQIAFLSTDLIGEDGARISAENIAFQPRELSLAARNTSVVNFRVTVPTGTRSGVYSGLVRASRLDYLHAVVMVTIES